MYRIKISATNPITLLSAASHLQLSATRLSHIWLEDVEFISGTWAEVFTHLMSCESLVYLSPQNLSYARGGKSLHLREFSGRMWEDGRDIWTDDNEELGSLYRLVRKLIEKAGGIENYPEHNNKQAGQDE